MKYQDEKILWEIENTIGCIAIIATVTAVLGIIIWELTH